MLTSKTLFNRFFLAKAGHHVSITFYRMLISITVLYLEYFLLSTFDYLSLITVKNKFYFAYQDTYCDY